MFTGIIENTGTIKEIISSGTNKSFWVEASLSEALKVDQSVSHNGVCLTVDELKEGMHRVTAIEETLGKTNLGFLQPGNLINIERCMQLNGRLDGHLVQGHVDDVAKCTAVITKDGSWEYLFGYDTKYAGLLIEKGSICLNGISLTVFNVRSGSFTVAVIPYTYNHTNMHQLQKGDWANVEFDVIGKYVNRLLSLKVN
jgi:riboflavin synthase